MINDCQISQTFIKTIGDALKLTGHYSDSDVMLFANEVKSLRVQKGDMLLNKGEVAKSLYFLLQGTVNQYSIGDNDSCQILDLHIEGEWFFNQMSFIPQEPSEVIISAFADSWLLEINIESLHFLIVQTQSFLQLNSIINHVTSRLQFFDHSLSPLQKYEFVFKNRPRLLQRYPLKMIASYLKITPGNIEQSS